MSQYLEETLLEHRRSRIRDPCLITGCSFRTAYFQEQRTRVNIEKEVQNLRSDNTRYRQAVGRLLEALEEALRPTNAIRKAFRERLRDLSGIKGVYQFVRGDVVHIWTMIERENFELEMRIAAAQSEILRVFDSFKFQFMIIPADDVPAESLIPQDAVLG